MKKTLIALLLIAGCGVSYGATAAGVLNSENTAITFNSAESQSAFIVCTLDVAKMKEWVTKLNTSDDINVFASFSLSNGKNIGAGVKNNGLKMTHLSSGSDLSNSSEIYTPTDEPFKNSAFSSIISEYLADATKVTLTIAYNDGDATASMGTGTTVYLSFVDSEYKTATISGVKTDLKWNAANITGAAIDTTYVTSADVFTGAWTAQEVGHVINYTLIPEPTTATLSLLALAGLAARRRRC